MLEKTFSEIRPRMIIRDDLKWDDRSATTKVNKVLGMLKKIDVQ